MIRFRLFSVLLVTALVVLILPLGAFAEDAVTGGIAEEVASDPDVLYALGTLLAVIVIVVSRHIVWLRGIAQSVKPVVNWADQLGLLSGIKGKEKLLAAIEAFEIEYKARTGQSPGPNEMATAVKLIEREVQATSGAAKDKFKEMLTEVVNSTDPASAVGNSSGGSD